MFGVHKGEGVVVMHYDGVAESPEIEEGAVYDVGEGGLRIIRNRLPEGSWIVSSSEEIPPSAT